MLTPEPEARVGPEIGSSLGGRDSNVLGAISGSSTNSRRATSSMGA